MRDKKYIFSWIIKPFIPGETDKVMNKWDNHNTIARGWAGMGKNYQPVTFRSIYNIGNKQESSFQL